ncbi:MAG TPA: DUF2304 family protein [Candidatus Paceibacterota bacterium]|nr:DUF2304 family protein [Verrucomicrobiota bacterium]HSA11887.1 DUF2304 family protein [Candidatus Paceibacterota bacterium]
MLIIQVLFVLFALFAISRTVSRFKRGSIGVTELIAWSGFWLAVGGAVLAPAITQWMADILGVGRGADAVFYIGLVALSYTCFRLYLKNRQIEQQLTSLVRELALRDTEEPIPQKPPQFPKPAE